MPPIENDLVAKLHGIDWQLEHMPCTSHETMQLRDALRGILAVLSPIAARPDNWRDEHAREANLGAIAPHLQEAAGPPVFDAQGALVSGRLEGGAGRSTVVITSPPPAAARAAPSPAPQPVAAAGVAAPAAQPAASRVVDIGAILGAKAGTPLAELAEPDTTDDSSKRFELLELDQSGNAGKGR